MATHYLAADVVRRLERAGRANPVRGGFESFGAVVDTATLERIADAFELDPDRILSGEIDDEALIAHRSGAVFALPRRYSRAASSRFRTARHLIDGLESRFGSRARARTLRALQVTESALADPDRRINIRFVTDVCARLRELGVTDDEFVRLGERSFRANRRGPLGGELREPADVARAYEKCFTELVPRYFDENFRYAFRRVDGNRFRVEAECHPDVCAELGQRRLGSRYTCLQKSGVIASFSEYRALPPAEVRKTACVHEGDARCRYEVDLAVPRAFEATRTPAEGVRPAEEA